MSEYLIFCYAFCLGYIVCEGWDFEGWDFEQYILLVFAPISLPVLLLWKIIQGLK